MGWWEQDEEGRSFNGGDRKPEPLLWGDEAADIVDDALWKIEAVFVKDQGRLPSVAEIMAGLTFSTAAGLDLPDRPENAQAAGEAQVEAVKKNYYIADKGDKPVPRDVLAAHRLIEGIITKLKKPFK